jgi:hypothetical protein
MQPERAGCIHGPENFLRTGKEAIAWSNQKAPVCGKNMEEPTERMKHTALCRSADVQCSEASMPSMNLAEDDTDGTSAKDAGGTCSGMAAGHTDAPGNDGCTLRWVDAPPENLDSCGSQENSCIRGKDSLGPLSVCTDMASRWAEYAVGPAFAERGAWARA